MVITSLVFLVLAAISVILRLVARYGFLKNGGSDEVAIVVALVSLVSTQPCK